MAVDERLAAITAVRTGTFIDREAAAMRLSRDGAAGHEALAGIVQDDACAVDARVTALRHLAARPAATAAVRVALRDPAPVLRVVALECTSRARVRELLPEVRLLIDDPGRVTDLAEEHIVGDVARRVATELPRAG